MINRLSQWLATFFTMAQILSLEIIEGPAVHLKHTVVITITCVIAKAKHTIVPLHLNYTTTKYSP